jgi:hypothetical protein
MRVLRALGTGLAVLVGMIVLGEAIARAASDSPRSASIGAVLVLAAVPLAIVAAVIVARRTSRPPTGASRPAGEPPVRAPIAGRLALAGGAVVLAAVAGLVWYPRAAPAPSSGDAAAAAGCWLRFELRALRDAIPDVVGDCVENARRDPASGDTVQRTTGGLLVLRQSDRRAGFTDGGRTWLQGPEGIVTRPNEERFAWEPDATTATPVAAATTPPPPAAPTPVPAATKPAAPASPPTATPRPVVVTGSGAGALPPSPTATLGPVSDDIMDAVLVGYLRRSGLPLTDIRALAPSADPERLLGRPGGPISKVVFRDQRTANGEQTMEMYADAAALQARVARLNDPASTHQAFTSPGSRTVLRLSKSMPPDQLRSYERWLQTLR